MPSKRMAGAGVSKSDIASGSEALMQAGLAQPGKVGVTGTSYGGYSAWFLITHYPPETFIAAVPICGMTDMIVDYNTTRPDLRPYDEEMMGGRPDQAPERYYRALADQLCSGYPRQAAYRPGGTGPERKP